VFVFVCVGARTPAHVSVTYEQGLVACKNLDGLRMWKWSTILRI